MPRSPADSVLAQREHGRKPAVILPVQANRSLPGWISGSTRVAPLVSGKTMEALLSARWMPIPLLAARKALSLGGI